MIDTHTQTNRRTGLQPKAEVKPEVEALAAAAVARRGRAKRDQSPLERAIENRGLASERTEAKERRKQRHREAKPLDSDVSPNKSASDITKADKHPTEPPNCEGIEGSAAKTEARAEAHD